MKDPQIISQHEQNQKLNTHTHTHTPICLKVSEAIMLDRA